jgi:hypothetical protein
MHEKRSTPLVEIKLGREIVAPPRLVTNTTPKGRLLVARNR